MLSIQHPDPVAFLTTQNDTVNIGDPDGLVNRPDNISFIKFSCTMDGDSHDARVTQADTLSYQVCLCLPHHLLDVATKSVSVVSVPISTTRKLVVSCLLGACFASTALVGRTSPHLPLLILQQGLQGEGGDAIIMGKIYLAVI